MKSILCRRKVFFRVLVVVVGLSLTSSPLFAQSSEKVLQLNNDAFVKLDISEYGGLYIDETGAMSLEDILNADVRFDYDTDTIYPSEYPTAHWLKFNLKATTNIKERWLVFKSDNAGYENLRGLSYVDAYYMKKEKLAASHRTGVYVARKEKTIKEVSSVNALPFSMQSGDSLSILMRVQDIESNPFTQFRLEMIHPDAGISNVSNRYKWAIFGSFGAYMVVGLYVLFFFFFTHKLSYLYFGLFAILFGMHYLFIGPSSTFIVTFIPDKPLLKPVLFSIIGFTYPLLFQFGRTFSETKKRLPKWDKYLQFLIWSTIILTLNSIWKNSSPPFAGFSIWSMVVLLMFTPVCIKFLLGTHLQSKIFALGVFWFWLWNIFGMLWNLEILNIPFNPWPVGQLGLLLIYGIGLGYDFMMNAKEKEKANRIKEMDEVKSKFFANISHEFRTPLSLILGPINQAVENIPASDPIASDDEIPIRAKSLKVIKRNALRLQNLVDQLLDLSKLDNGKMQLKLREGKLIQFLRSIVFSFESLVERKHIHFNTNFPEEQDHAFFDRDKLEKILVNLLSNAFKFTPEHGSISVNTSIDNQRLKISISDSGEGMELKEIEKVFERFYQVEGTEAYGTGIGLSLVKELVELHRGQISVNSVKGEGTTFKVTIPYQRTDFKAHEITSAAIEKTNGHTPLELFQGEEVATKEALSTDPEKPLVLIVEDNPDLQVYIREQLESSYQIIIAKDGKQGLDKAIAKIPDLIISDVMMPKMNGIELSEILKKDSRTSHIPIILLTAKAAQSNKIEGLQSGADDYLTKPFDSRELLARSQNLIDQRKRLRDKFQGELKIRPSKVNLQSLEEQFIKQVMEEIEKNISNEFYTVEDLAKAIGFSRSQLNRKLKAICNQSANHLIREFRLTRAKEMLEQKSGSISEVAYSVGYNNLSYFSKSFKEAFGVSPSEV